MRKGNVFVHGVYAGKLTETGSGKYVFEYDEQYRLSAQASPVCIAMPLHTARYESDSLFPFFSNLLSEGENRQLQARLHHVDEKDDFGILLATAGSDTIGCVTVTAEKDGVQ